MKNILALTRDELESSGNGDKVLNSYYFSKILIREHAYAFGYCGNFNGENLFVYQNNSQVQMISISDKIELQLALRAATALSSQISILTAQDVDISTTQRARERVENKVPDTDE